MTMETQPVRPIGITVLGLLSILIGLFGFLGGAVLLMSSDSTVAGLSAVAVVVGLLYVVCGIGFFQRQKWAWPLGIVVGVLSVARNIVEASTGLITTAIPGIVIALVILYYLTTPRIKTYFGRGTKVA